jgi:hypothetical protein
MYKGIFWWDEIDGFGFEGYRKDDRGIRHNIINMGGARFRAQLAQAGRQGQHNGGRWKTRRKRTTNVQGSF